MLLCKPAQHPIRGYEGWRSQHSGCQYRIEVFQTCVLLLSVAAVSNAGQLYKRGIPMAETDTEFRRV